ncbi:hypothetical protein RYZ20_11350 [Thioclava sp. A2]|nr:hypothetical protein [Thioclava sp. A2]
MKRAAAMITLRDDELRVSFAIERLLAPGADWRGLVRDLVKRWPDEPPLELSLTLVAAASAIEQSFSSVGPSGQAAMHGYRLAALLSVDFYAMQLLDMPRERAADFLAYWEIDPFFARL